MIHHSSKLENQEDLVGHSYPIYRFSHYGARYSVYEINRMILLFFVKRILLTYDNWEKVKKWIESKKNLILIDQNEIFLFSRLIC